MAPESRIGVWVEDGKVFWRNSEKHFSARVAAPLSPDLLLKVLEKVKVISGAESMDSWTPAVEANLDKNYEDLQKLTQP